MANNNRLPETKEEARQRKYRYLYRVRTAHGDIISKVGLIEDSPICISLVHFLLTDILF